ncbi:MAG: DNA-directed RNA polymerase subunit alpha [Anaerolineales bacterium]|nr:DNA-directed RNA polymerase subunit alpha [Anaerolineales bacterium]MCB0013758.1 DNA-directed RNA polymerase subunit alpha [Anaerolineales bacterium]MCB0029777.1 DNA-directed RNA polymerase subunit alpha [Anaerolineales bacterium]
MSRNYGRFVISPLERGYGTTVGNSLRRVLLASLPGAAITSIRVTDVPHEFSAIPHVREDMMQMILQVKQLRLLLHDVDTARLRLEVHGAGTVTAADLILPPEVEIINPDLYLFTVDSDEAFLEIEMTAETGRGFSPAEERGRLPIGELPIDAIFSPIRRVGYEVEKTRVGQDANYDRLVMEIWTDGTVRPETSLAQAAQILTQHLRPLVGVSEETLIPIEEETEEKTINNELYDTPIEQLDLSVRVFNSLKRTGITKVGEMLEMLERGEETMLAIRNFGEKSLDELKAQLRAKGFLLNEDEAAG